MTKYEFTDCASQAGSTPASPTPSRCAPPCILDPAACISTPAGAKGVPCMRLLRLSSQSKVSERNPLPVGLVCPAARDSLTRTPETLCASCRAAQPPGGLRQPRVDGGQLQCAPGGAGLPGLHTPLRKTHQPAPPDRILVKAQVRYFVTSTDPKKTTNKRGPQAPKTHQPAPPDRILFKAQVWQFA